MRKIVFSILAVSALVFTSCSSDGKEDPIVPQVQAPTNYEFVDKDGVSNVSFSGQVIRLKMAGELKSALGTNTKTEAQLVEMFKDGKGFSDASITGKQLRGTVGSATNSNVTSVEADALRTKMDGWIKDHATTLYTNWANDASAGVPGKLARGSKTIYVSAKGVEYNQAVAKTLIGSVIADQIINKYVSQKFIDDKKADNDAGVVYKEGKNYTALQHGWDEAYGYIFGMEVTPSTPVNTVNDRKGFLNSYLKSVDNDTKFKGIFDDINNAFKLGRAAVDAKDYTLASKQAEIIRKSVSKVIGVMSVHYLLKGKGTRDGDALHALSEAYGFVTSLRFVEINGSQANASHVSTAIAALEAGNGLWSVTDANLDATASTIAAYFGFDVADAVSLKD
jgi:hypothetical protein